MVNTPHESVVLVSRKFSSFEELSDIARGWDADFRQLGAEHFKSELFQAIIGSMLITKTRIGCSADKKGTTPKGMRTFAIPDKDCPVLHWYGHILEQEVLLCFPAHGEIDAFSGPGFSALTFSIPENLFTDFFERNQHPQFDKIARSRERYFSISSSQANELRETLQQASEVVVNADAIPNKNVLIGDIQEKLLLFLLKIFSKMEVNSIAIRSHQHNALKDIFDYTRANSDEPIRLSDLCNITNLSERSLQYIFKRQLGITPKSYLSAYRLSGVHRELWSTDKNEGNVSDVANYWGFWHMGQFAADYRKLFGELPSNTLNRNT